MGSGAIETVIWLGAGASYGSQDGKIKGPPPVTPRFFEDRSVRSLLRGYPVLHALWQIYGKPDNLEKFWNRLDDGYNSPAQLPGCDINAIEKRLRSSPNLAGADKPRKEYYHAKINALPAQTTVGTYLQAVAVAGWEIKHLLVKLLDRKDYDLTLHQRLFKAVQDRFAVLTFNYDTIAEQALKKQGFGFRYEPAGDGTVFVSKPHGSIQWEWIKPTSAFLTPVTLSPLHPYGLIRGDTTATLFRDSLLIGLRTKRELTGQDSAGPVNHFWDERLCEAQRALQSANRVIVVGFAFQEADSYLWERLSAKQIGSRKRILLCDRKTDDAEKEALRNKVKSFFDTDDVRTHWNGFDESFIRALKA